MEIAIKGDNNKIVLGKNVAVINFLNVQILENCKKGEIVIGDNCSFWKTLIQTCELNSRINIGKDCMFSFNTSVMNSDGHCIFQDGNLINIGKDLIIKDHCWIGYDAIIYKNSYIGENSIVGRNAFVSGIFKKTNVVLGGLPAKVIKENVNWSRQNVNEYIFENNLAETLLSVKKISQ